MFPILPHKSKFSDVFSRSTGFYEIYEILLRNPDTEIHTWRALLYLPRVLRIKRIPTPTSPKHYISVKPLVHINEDGSGFFEVSPSLIGSELLACGEDSDWCYSWLGAICERNFRELEQAMETIENGGRADIEAALTFFSSNISTD